MNPKKIFMLNETIKNTLRLFYKTAYRLMGSKRFMPGYDVVLPVANYSPWLLDKDFNKALESVKDYTLVDKYRLWDLWTLVRQAPAGGYLVEVGCWRGGSSALTTFSRRMAGYDEKMLVFDTFKGVVKTGRYDPDYHDGDHNDANLLNVYEVFSKLGLIHLKDYLAFAGIFPDETGLAIKDNDKISFIHMDLDVYKSTKDSMNYLWSKLLPGGMVVFDDYGFEACKGVTKYVNDQMNREDMIIIHNLNGHAVMIKK